MEDKGIYIVVFALIGLGTAVAMPHPSFLNYIFNTLVGGLIGLLIAGFMDN